MHPFGKIKAVLGFMTIATMGTHAMIGAGGALAADLPKVVQGGKISYIMNHRRWTAQASPERQECPKGMNLGPREQFQELFPDDGKKRTVVETYLQREVDQWLPTKGSVDPFPFREAQGPIVNGMNLDGKVKPTDFADAAGQMGIDNQLYRAIGCIKNFRGPSLTVGWLYEDEYVRTMPISSFIIEMSGVESLVNDDDVTVKSYRGRDPQLAEAVASEDGAITMAGGTQRIDERWGKFVQSTWKGRIVDGTLMTEPSDVILPSATIRSNAPIIPFKGLRYRLKLHPERAKGVMAGYVDLQGFRQYLTSWDQTSHSQGEMPVVSLIRAIDRLADGYPDPKTGEMAAISSAMDVEFTQVYIIHPKEHPLAALSDRRQAAGLPANSAGR